MGYSLPKPRLSTSRRRREFFKRKYTCTVVPLRYKVQIDRMEQSLDDQLTILDELEKQVYEYLETITFD